MLFSWKTKQFVFSQLYSNIVPTRQLKINNLTIRDYRLHVNNKLYNVSVVTDDIKDNKYKCMKTLKKSIDDNISKRNMILHCSFLDSESEKTIDLTETFRQFFLHFDENNKECEMEHFFLYVVRTHQLDKRIIDDMSLYLILNDSQFSEKYYNVQDIYSFHFYDIVNDVKN